MGIVLGAYQNAAKKTGFLAIGGDRETAPAVGAKVDLVSYAVQKAVYLPQSVLNWGADGVSDFLNGIWSAGSLSQRNLDLEAQLADAKQSGDRMIRLESEITRLRGLAGLPQFPARTKVAADIVGFFPAEQRIALNVGSGRKIGPGDAVVCETGLLGQVVEVSPGGCYVNLLTHPDFSVGARVVRNESQEAGIANGQGSAQLLLNLYSETADIRVGDTITTSGLSQVYPEGISVGKVAQTWFNKNLGIRQAVISTAVNLAKVRQVVVLAR